MDTFHPFWTLFQKHSFQPFSTLNDILYLLLTYVESISLISFRDTYMATKRSRNDIDLKTKYEILKLLDQGWKQRELASKYEVNESTICRLKKNKDNVTEQYELGRFSISTKRKRTIDLELVDTALLEWFQANAAQPGLVGTILLEKAIQFAKLLGFSEEFRNRIDISWINRFKARHSIIAKRIHGESASASLDQVSLWKETILPGIIQKFQMGNIFNIDETGLFWKLLPERTLQFKGIDCKGGKHAKDRITILVGASALGEKLPLMVIGKSQKPRCFANSHIPIDYQSNSKAWMNSNLFTSYVRKIDQKMYASSRKIVLIVDNCPCDPQIENLRNTKLMFLPPNTTAFTQPMDAGVIRNFKYHYKLDLVRRRIAAIDNNQEFSINLLQATL